MSNTDIPQVPVTVYEFITADIARALLALNKDYQPGVAGTNRPLRPKAIEKYARDMLEGNWEVTNQGIGLVGPEGAETLIDGQHRLHALLLAARTDPKIRILMAVTKGLKEEAAWVIDTNQGRHGHDVLAMKLGVKNPLTVSGVLRLVHLYDGVPWSLNAWTKLRLTHNEILALGEKHAEGVEKARLDAQRIGKIIPSSPMIAATYIVGRDRPDVDFEEFLIGLKTGANLAEKSPILALRNYGLNALNNQQRREGPQMLSLTFKAINYWITNETRQNLRFSALEGFTYLTTKPWSKR